MSKEIVNYEEQLAAMAKQAVASEKPTGSSISVRSGILQYNGQPIAGNKLDCIVVASTHVNLYYEGRYDPNNITSPVCFAYSETGDGEMGPHPASSKPQHTDCKTCPSNAWGSDPDGGKGKACKNSRSLGLIPMGVEDIASAEVAVLKLPVMSVKNWQMYVQKITTLFNRPPLGMVTTIGVVPDAKSQFRVTFTDVAPVGKELLPALFSRSQQVQELLEFVYEANVDKPAVNNKAKKY